VINILFWTVTYASQGRRLLILPNQQNKKGSMNNFDIRKTQRYIENKISAMLVMAIQFMTSLRHTGVIFFHTQYATCTWGFTQALLKMPKPKGPRTFFSLSKDDNIGVLLLCSLKSSK
jgi:hypothetical protein